MSTFSLDIDDLLSDVQSLKITALSHAAAISHLIEKRTIGPDCHSNVENAPDGRNEQLSFGSENDQNLSNLHTSDTEHDSSGGDGKTVRYVPDLRVTFSSRSDKAAKSPNSRKVDISDCRAVSFKMYQQEIEKKRKNDVKMELEKRQAKFREFDRMRDIKHNERIAKAENDVVKRVQENEQMLLETIREQERVAEEFEARRKAEIEEENQRLTEISQLLKRKEQEMKRRHALINEIRSQQANFRKMTDSFTNTMGNMDKEFSANFSNQKKTVQGLAKSFEQLLHNVNANREASQQDVDKAVELCKLMEQTNTEVIEIMNRIQKEIADRLKKEEEQAQTQGQEHQQVSDGQVAPLAAQDTTDTTQKNPQPTVSLPHPLAAFVSQEGLVFYTEIKSFYEQHQTAVKALLDDVSMKTYRFNCQKVINTPVNAISAVSREHFVDKFNKLDALLSGQSVKTGDTAVSINGHPLGRTYCTMLLAKKFVSQADTMISSNAPAAFPIAAIIVGLWQKYPDFGRFFLAYLHKECPYLVPYFLPQLEGQTQGDYLKSIGYRFSSDGVLEKQDQYLKRMTGLARLYAAVVVSNPKRGETSLHPHSLECGWRWLCNILNLCPLPDICATLINEFLQTAGGLLWAHYGNQFVKVLKVIQEQYLPALNKVDEGGPKARLEGLVAKITAEGRIDRPEGMLSPDFW